MVERFNGRISDLVNQTRFLSAAELDDTLKHYLSTYNHLIPQRALKHQSPIQALQKWRTERPDLFVKCVYNLAGLDTSPPLTCPKQPRAINPCRPQREYRY
jgi:hypothetical protein